MPGNATTAYVFDFDAWLNENKDELRKALTNAANRYITSGGESRDIVTCAVTIQDGDMAGTGVLEFDLEAYMNMVDDGPAEPGK